LHAAALRGGSLNLTHLSQALREVEAYRKKNEKTNARGIDSKQQNHIPTAATGVQQPGKVQLVFESRDDAVTATRKLLGEISEDDVPSDTDADGLESIREGVQPLPIEADGAYISQAVEEYWKATATREDVRSIATQIVHRQLLPLHSVDRTIKKLVEDAIQDAVETEVRQQLEGLLFSAVGISRLTEAVSRGLTVKHRIVADQHTEESRPMRKKARR